MPVFISYSHQDKDFVNQLAAQLVLHKTRVWIDKWELKVGDSIIESVQTAIQGASAFIVVLSNASVDSNWCKKEINSGLLRELEEKRVVVLPLLIQDCEIPIFLREKLYADFRTDFDSGLKTLLDAIARVTSDSLGRVEQPEWHIDWAIDWGMVDDLFMIRIIMVEQADNKPYSVLSEVAIVANEVATARYKTYEENGLDWWGRFLIINALGELETKKDLFFILEDSFAKERNLGIKDTNSDLAYEILVTCRRMGEDNGFNVHIDYGSQLGMVRKSLQDTLRKPTPMELARIKQLMDQRNQE